MENNGSQTIYNNIASPDGNDRNEANEINLNKGKNDSFPLDFNQINEISESKLTAHFQNSNNNSVKEMNNPLNNKLSQSDIPSSNFNVIPHQTDVKENKSLNLTPNYNNNSPFNNISQNQTITNLPNFSQNDISALNQNNNQIQTNLPNFNENMDNRFDQNNQNQNQNQTNLPIFNENMDKTFNQNNQNQTNFLTPNENMDKTFNQNNNQNQNQTDLPNYSKALTLNYNQSEINKESSWNFPTLNEINSTSNFYEKPNEEKNSFLLLQKSNSLQPKNKEIDINEDYNAAPEAINNQNKYQFSQIPTQSKINTQTIDLNSASNINNNSNVSNFSNINPCSNSNYIQNMSNQNYITPNDYSDFKKSQTLQPQRIITIGNNNNQINQYPYNQSISQINNNSIYTFNNNNQYVPPSTYTFSGGSINTITTEDIPSCTFSSSGGQITNTVIDQVNNNNYYQTNQQSFYNNNNSNIGNYSINNSMNNYPNNINNYSNNMNQYSNINQQYPNTQRNVYPQQYPNTQRNIYPQQYQNNFPLMNNNSGIRYSFYGQPMNL